MADIEPPDGPFPTGTLLPFYDPAEKDFQRHVRAFAELHGWAVYCTWDPRHAPAGESDLRMYRPPRIVHAELKRNNKPGRQQSNPTAVQIAYLDLVRACGVEAFLWRPHMWNHLVAVLA